MVQKYAYVLICSVLLIAPIASGYEVIAVANGGTIKGSVTVADKSLQDETLTISKDTSYCGDSLPADKYLVSGEGGLKNAVVMIEGITQGKALESEGEFLVTNNKCRFEPHVLVVPKGGLMKVRNDDPLLHNSHFFLVVGDKKKNVINLALPKQGIVIGKKKILRKPGLLSIQCDAHDFMQAWAWVTDHPYAIVTAADGSFTLDDVPPGSYKLRIWHEGLGEKSLDVTVQAGKTATASVIY